jgi:hypothetical protein
LKGKDYYQPIRIKRSELFENDKKMNDGVVPIKEAT